MKNNAIVFVIITVLVPSILFAQDNKDKVIFKEFKAGFYQNSILKDMREFSEKKETPDIQRILKIDLAGVDLPNKIDLYKSQWCNSPVSQGNTSMCWCFSTTSFYETEVFRLTGQKVKLSEMFTVYWEFIEKAKEYIRTRGTSAFEEGSEGNAVQRIYKKYGIVPRENYTGMLPGQKFYNHDEMKKEMDSYLKWVKNNSAWNEEEIISTIKSIMNFYMGVPPEEITIDGKKITPKQYLNDVLKMKMDDYVDILSYLQKPFYKKVEYEVPDNWWHSTDYYNVPLDDYIKFLKQAINNGYTMAIGGDVSEAGLETAYQVALIPIFDIPVNYIDDNSRQFRFSNKTTTDDHGMHLVGYYEKDGVTWFLIKDSSSGSRNNDPNAKEFGYYFFREDYIKLKIMDFHVHKDAVKDLLTKFK